MLYLIIEANGVVAAETIYRQYDRVADDLYQDHLATPIGRRERRNKLDDLVSRRLVASTGAQRQRQVWTMSHDSPDDS